MLQFKQVSIRRGTRGHSKTALTEKDIGRLVSPKVAKKSDVLYGRSLTT